MILIYLKPKVTESPFEIEAIYEFIPRILYVTGFACVIAPTKELLSHL